MTATTGDRINLMDLQPFIRGRENEQFAYLREHEPIHWNDEADGPGFWSVTRYQDVMDVLGAPEIFINGDGTQILSRKVEGNHATVHNTDPPRHSKLRKVGSPHLRASKIRGMSARIDEIVSDVLDDVQDKSDVEIVHAATALVPIQVLGELLGVPREDGHLLMGWTNRVISDDAEFMESPDEKERARNELFDYFAGLTQERRKQPQDDVISKLVASDIDGEPLGWEDLAAYYFVLVGAGNETTRNLLTGSILAFDQFPGEWRRLQNDPSLQRSATEELLRFVSPARSFRRTAAEDAQILGQKIAAGDKVVAWFQAANRDPAVFETPNELRIDRKPNFHLGFGWGIHQCMGSHLARAEANSFFRQTIERGITFRPLGEPERLHSNQFHAFKRLRVAVETS